MWNVTAGPPPPRLWPRPRATRNPQPAFANIHASPAAGLRGKFAVCHDAMTMELTRDVGCDVGHTHQSRPPPPRFPP
eukprot:scaffold882_cov21-Tisochrysis_lutea.AAC.1